MAIGSAEDAVVIRLQQKSTTVDFNGELTPQQRESTDRVLPERLRSLARALERGDQQLQRGWI